MSTLRKFLQSLFVLLTGFLAISFCAHVYAQKDGYADAKTGLYEQIVPKVHRKGLIWKIEGPGISPSHLMGTMHVDDPMVLDMLNMIKKELQNADTVCTEVKMDFQAIAAEMKSMFFHDGRTLKSVTGDELYASILRVARERSLPEVMIKNMKPWVTAYMLSAPLPEGQVLDEKIYNDALVRGQKVCGLETSEEHGAVFDSLPMQDQVYMLRQTIEHIPETKESYQILRKAYLERDLYGLVEASWTSPWMADSTIIDNFIDELVIKRNKRMAVRMQKVLKKGNAFFAIGALHLPGEMGVLRLLEKQGYRVSVVY